MPKSELFIPAALNRKCESGEYDILGISQCVLQSLYKFLEIYTLNIRIKTVTYACRCDGSGIRWFQRDTWRYVTGVFVGAQEALKHMGQGGRIIQSAVP